jgi:hypothetical protein
MFERMKEGGPGGDSSLRNLVIVGNGWTADLLEESGINTVADVWALDLDDDGLIQRLITAAQALAAAKTVALVNWENVLLRAYNRIILIRAVDYADDHTDAPYELRCSISHGWPDHPVVSPAGHLYDRVWIERWVRSAGTDPFTREPLLLSQLAPVPHAFADRIVEERSKCAVGIVPTCVSLLA